MRKCRLALLLVAFACVGMVGSATGPSFWIVATQSEFVKGQSDGVSVDELGRLTAGPAVTSTADLNAPQVWSVAVAPDGTWYAGTGGDGRVVRGRIGQTPTATFFQAEEHNIYALAIGPNGRVYAASSPDGKVYAIERDGTSRTFFDPGEKYIWALAVDRRNRLWVATGTPATLYRVDPDGTSKAIYKPPADHVVSLAVDADDRVLAGTEAPGRLYRFDANDRPSALLESGMTELRSIAIGRDGAIYAAALAAGDGAASGDGSNPLSIGTAAASGTSSTASSSGASQPKSAIFRIAPTGVWDTLWESTNAIYDLAVADDQTVLAATGPNGNVYRVRPNGSVVLVNAVDAKEITRLAAVGGEYLLACANPGRLATLGSAPAASSTYLSPVRDAKSVALWGEIRWEATAGVAIYTRSGNTDKADDSWSEWAGPYPRQEGEAIRSPQARYLQWKAVFSGGGPGSAPSLTSVTVAYLPKNSRPTVSSITVHLPGVIFQKPYAGDDGAVAGLDDAVKRPVPADTAPPMPLGKRMFQKGWQTIGWKADDADGDRLTYALAYRREGESAWHDLRAGLSDPIFVWDTATVPDGRYVIKVTASDSASNTADRALTGERESDAFDIDNTPPVITVTIARESRGIVAHVRVRDAQSPIDKVEYAIGGGAWTLVYPVDGLADSREEQYEIVVKSEADLNQMVIRATDLMQNVLSQPAVMRRRPSS